MIVDGEFYIDDQVGDFYLRQRNAWNPKGQLVRTNVSALWTEEASPYAAGQVFELGPSKRPVRYSQAFSAPRSLIRCAFPSHGSLSVVLTDDLAGYLKAGRRALCVASFTPASLTADLAFADAVVPAFSRTWVVMPAVADPAFAGLLGMWAGEPSR